MLIDGTTERAMKLIGYDAQFTVGEKAPKTDFCPPELYPLRK
jgi:hypothetical protein